jgi:hypothetical protein
MGRSSNKSFDDSLDLAGSRTEVYQRWCIFTSAGDHNSIRLWLKGDAPRRWDLVAAYYGDNEHEFVEISKMSSYAFRTKGGKFPILKKLVEQKPELFEQYSHVWVCDDDIQMSAEQIDEAFAISEYFEFWIAQPAFLPKGKISHELRSTPDHNVIIGSSILSR